MKLTSQKDRYNKLAKRLNKYILRIDNIFNSLSMEASKIVVSTKHQSGEFSFSNYPETKDKINQLQSDFTSSILGTVHSGISEEWKNSNLAQDLIADEVLAKAQSKIKGKRYNRYYQTNNDALKAFLNRKDNGMNLSTKIWNLSTDYKNELEHAISTSVEKGISAITLSKRIAKYLNDFPSLKKDFKEKFGKAATCYDCEYRTMRLARTEINMAYRTAEGERWRQFDFVIGIEIKLSKNHNCKGVPHGQFYDICDTLAGKYPKDFKFVGWHPNCRCYQIPILAKDDELDELLDVGDKNNNQPVTELPNQFQQWLKDNQKRIENAKGLPYFIKDNQNLIGISYNKSVYGHKAGIIINADKRLTEQTWKALKDDVAVLTKIQQENAKEVAEIVNASFGKPMRFEDVDSGNVNPKFGQSTRYNTNCILSVLASEARARGINVRAAGVIDSKGKKKDISYILGENMSLAWIDPKTMKSPILTKYSIDGNYNKAFAQIQELTKDNGRYYVGFDGEYCHGLNIYRRNGKFYVYDQQQNLSRSLLELLKKSKATSFEVLRIDNLLLDKTNIDHWIVSL